MLVLARVPEVVQWSPVIAAAIALAATGAAWRTAAITARSFRRSVLPDLHPMFILETGMLTTGALELICRNLGGGAATTVAVMIVVEDRAMHVNVGAGFLKPGHGFRIATEIPATGVEHGDYKAVVSCRDVNGLYHGWSHAGEHREFRDRLRRPIQEIDLRDVFRSFFPDAELEGQKSIRYQLGFLDP